MNHLSFHKYQAAKLLILILSLTLIPFLSTSLRPSYLYFLINIFIIVLGYESGILHAFVEPVGEKKPTATAAAAAPLPGTRTSVIGAVKQASHEGSPAMTEERPLKKFATTKSTHQTAVRRNPSVPSLFFIGSYDDDWDPAEDCKEELEEEDVFESPTGEISSRELFARAESFIGNFYKQLKIQREESWKKIHGFYHKPS